ncbi:DUF397 domain-containing protein [Streptomyces kebangsaanensis]|uniref:DUF397 domain-containing protein n=1 Tax=Streptomyces kebangsaanensis TaxID=864058 RepID=UPI0009A0F40E|nr:DUF397 domain-containing protein [Streptomyces kebangsaanensis]
MLAQRFGALACGGAQPPTTIRKHHSGSSGIGGTAVVHEGRPLWRKSSACGNETECVEVAVHARRVLARDSKQPATAVLHFTAVAWTGFLRAVSRGELKDS